MGIYVTGHQNPDTDSICAAITYAALKNQLGLEVEAIRVGKVNAETEYVLERFAVEAPKLLTEVGEGDQVILVDHNETSQAVSGIKEAEVLEVIDHHRIGGLETGNPIYFRNEPVGCTSTIITKLYQENEVEIPKKMAGLLLSAILSDTVIFRSPTCTKDDQQAAKMLAEKLGLEIEKVGKEIFQAGSVTNKLAPAELIENDYKEYQLGPKTVGVGQLEVMDVAEVDEIKAELKSEAEKLATERGYDFLLLLVTDILAEGSLLIYTDQAEEIIKSAFKVEVADNEVYLDGVLSRKKQIIPVLSKHLGV